MRIFISEEQEKYIKENLLKNNNRISKIIGDVENDNTPFSDFINKKTLENIVVKEYSKTKEEFSDNIEMFSLEQITTKLDKLIFVCQKKEKPLKEQLEKLCYDCSYVLKELSKIKYKISCNLVNEISDKKLFNISEEEYQYNSLDDKKIIASKEIQHKIVNLLTIGAAMYISENLFMRHLNDIFLLDNDLPHLYNKIVKINQYLLFITDCEITDSNNYQSAYNEINVDYNNKNIDLSSYGIIFPFLLAETIRGSISIFAFDSLPDDIEEAELILRHTENIKDEPLYMIIGKWLWSKIMNVVHDNSIETILAILEEFFSLDTSDFNKIMVEFINNTKIGDEMVGDIVRSAEYNNKYNSFTSSIKDRQKKELTITDGKNNIL